MSRKGTKIKRYGSIYGRNSNSLVMVSVMIAGLVLFGVAGWFLYTPVHDFIMGLGEEKPGELPASSQQASPPSSQQPEASSAPVAASSDIKGIYLPPEAVLLQDSFSASLDKAAEAGFNTVLLEGKDASGTVHYSSQNDIAASAGVAADDTFDAAAAAKEIKSRGLSPAVRLYAFEDSLAPIVKREFAVKYYDSDIYWFDNSPELGGKPWLNPFSAGAREYIVSLIDELCASGFETVLLDSVQFPSGVGLDKAGFGSEAQAMTKAEALGELLAAAKAAAAAHGARVIMCMDGDWLAPGTDNEWLYGGDPAALFTDDVIFSMGEQSAVWRERISQSAEHCVKAPLALIPAYAADGVLLKCGEQLNAASEAGAGGCILFSPQGNYRYN